MNKAMQIALAVLLIAVFLILARQQQALSQQQQQIQTLTAALAGKSKQETLFSQNQCSETANKFLSNRHYERTDGFGYQSHFNAKLNKCFVLTSYYSLKDDFLSLDLFDAVEGKHYAEFNGHNICEASPANNPKKCLLDSGSIWFDGNDAKASADFTCGFRGLRFGEFGNENTQKMFRDHIQPFMND